MCSPISTTIGILEDTARNKRSRSSIDAFLSNLQASTMARKKTKKQHTRTTDATTRYVQQVRRIDDSDSDRASVLPETSSSTLCALPRCEAVPDSQDAIYRTIHQSGIFSLVNVSVTTIQTSFNTNLMYEEARLLPKTRGLARYPYFARF